MKVRTDEAGDWGTGDHHGPDRPAYVLIRYETYQRRAGREPGIRDLLVHPESEDVAFEPPRLGGTDRFSVFPIPGRSGPR